VGIIILHEVRNVIVKPTKLLYFQRPTSSLSPQCLTDEIDSILNGSGPTLGSGLIGVWKPGLNKKAVESHLMKKSNPRPLIQ
jgi:hypothetical protein